MIGSSRGKRLAGVVHGRALWQAVESAHEAHAEQQREPRRRQPQVPLAQRDFERLAQLQDHRAAGIGPRGFEEADVALRDTGDQREIELRPAPLLAPFAQQARETLGDHIHATSIAGRRAGFNNPGGN